MALDIHPDDSKIDPVVDHALFLLNSPKIIELIKVAPGTSFDRWAALSDPAASMARGRESVAALPWVAATAGLSATFLPGRLPPAGFRYAWSESTGPPTWRAAHAAYSSR